MSLSELQKQELRKEVENFYNKLELYRDMVVDVLNKGEMTKPQWQKFNNLRIELLQLYGQLKEVIEECATSTITLRGVERDVFQLALGYEKIQEFTFKAVQFASSQVIIVIGKLRAKPLPKTLLDSTEMISPKAFVAHGGKTPARDKLTQFLIALGVNPLVVEDQPTKGRDINDKVEHYLEQADCAIILATADDKVGEKLQPRQNVIHETGLAQRTFPDRIIYLLEKEAEFPSNIKPKVWVSFTQECMDEAFIVVARELNSFGLLKSVKPAA